jgi:hypothetical protein
MLAVAAWIAQQERFRLADRTKAGLQRARAAGKQLGRPKVVFDRAEVVERRAAAKVHVPSLARSACPPELLGWCLVVCKKRRQAERVSALKMCGLPPPAKRAVNGRFLHETESRQPRD